MKNAFRFAALAGLVLATAHCSDGARLAPSPASSTANRIPSPDPTPVAPTRTALATFTATVDHQANTIHFARIGDGAAALTAEDQKRGLKPDSLNSVPDPQNANGSPTPGEVDLVTTSCTNSYPVSAFSCNVELISAFTRDLPNLYVQVSNATLGGVTTTAYDSTNSSPELDTTNDGTLVQSHGLWNYSAAGVNKKAPWPFMGGSGEAGQFSSTVTWDFLNPGNANVVYTIVVWATEYWASYDAFGIDDGDGKYGNQNYADACGSGHEFTSGGSNAITLPFDFTLFNTDSTTLNICEVGEFTLGSQTCQGNTLGAEVLPNALVPTNPIFFAFWDKLTYGQATNDQAPKDGTKKAGRTCYKTIGTAPNQIEVIEWRNMDFASGNDQGSSLDFEAFLYEGTGEIDLFYEEMANSTTNPNTGRANCGDTAAPCYIGTQGKDNSGNGSTSNTTLVAFGAGESLLDGAIVNNTAFTFIPSP